MENIKLHDQRLFISAVQDDPMSPLYQQAIKEYTCAYM